jgi:hypothetical protein
MRVPVCLGLLLLACAARLPAVASGRLEAELTRLRADVPAVIPEASRAALVSRLDRAGRALASGHTYLALYDLQVVYEAEAGYRLASTEKRVPDHAVFTDRWKAMGAPPDPPAARASVVFIEALAQSAEGRAPATYRASLPYAEDAGIMAGLYYLGESHAMVRFAALCRSADAVSRGRAPRLGSIESALAAFEKTVVKAYDTASAADRPRYAQVNVAIKLARTLDGEGRHEGALLQYLVSMYRHAMIVHGVKSVSLNAVKTRLDSTRLPAGTDHSVAEFFLQLASATMTGPDASAASASVILDQVLPAYFEVVGN